MMRPFAFIVLLLEVEQLYFAVGFSEAAPLSLEAPSFTGVSRFRSRRFFSFFQQMEVHSTGVLSTTAVTPQRTSDSEETLSSSTSPNQRANSKNHQGGHPSPLLPTKDAGINTVLSVLFLFSIAIILCHYICFAGGCCTCLWSGYLNSSSTSNSTSTTGQVTPETMATTPREESSVIPNFGPPPPRYTLTPPPEHKPLLDCSCCFGFGKKQQMDSDSNCLPPSYATTVAHQNRPKQSQNNSASSSSSSVLRIFVIPVKRLCRKSNNARIGEENGQEYLEASVAIEGGERERGMRVSPPTTYLPDDVGDNNGITPSQNYRISNAMEEAGVQVTTIILSASNLSLPPQTSSSLGCSSTTIIQQHSPLSPNEAEHPLEASGTENFGKRQPSKSTPDVSSNTATHSLSPNSPSASNRLCPYPSSSSQEEAQEDAEEEACCSSTFSSSSSPSSPDQPLSEVSVSPVPSRDGIYLFGPDLPPPKYTTMEREKKQSKRRKSNEQNLVDSTDTNRTSGRRSLPSVMTPTDNNASFSSSSSSEENMPPLPSYHQATFRSFAPAHPWPWSHC